MKRLNAGHAVGLAVLILALNLLVTTAVITTYILMTGRQSAAPGFAGALAVKVANWSAPIGGGLLFFVTSWVLARRRPDRNALGFAGLMWLAYVIVDVASGLALGDARSMLSMQMAASMGVALVGAIAGSTLARRSAG